jgi:hypothetical protein
MKKFRIFQVLLILSVLNYSCSNNSKNVNKDFAEIIYKAISEGQKKIDIPKGVYYMEMKNGRPLTLDSLKDIEINANGSEVITRLASQAIQISNCENIKISGFSIDCDTLPFTQGKIVTIDSIDRMWWEIEIMDGYPLGSLGKSMPDRVQIFDPKTNNLKKNLYTYFPGVFSKVEKTGERRFRFEKKTKNPDSNEVIGDFVVMTLPLPGTRPHTIVTSKSKNIQFEDVIIYSGNCFGFFEDQCEANIYNRCQVNKKLDDPRVAYPRLRSINADAFHSKGATIGPKITNCIFMYQGDDCIAINTSFYKVLTGKGDVIDLAAGMRGLKMKIGNMLRFVDFEGRVVGDARLMKMESVTDYSKSDLDRLTEMFKATRSNRREPSITRLYLDRKVNVATGGVVSSLNMGGSGFVVKDNKMGYTRARGILVKSSDGVISGNEITGCELSGIILAPELFWMEAGFSRNVTIENNTIKDCMFANSSYGIEQAAYISVIAINASHNIVPVGGFKNITVQNNILENSPVPAMIFTSVDTALVTGNKITISKEIIRTHGKNFGVDNKQVIWTKNTSNLNLGNNTIID